MPSSTSLYPGAVHTYTSYTEVVPPGRVEEMRRLYDEMREFAPTAIAPVCEPNWSTIRARRVNPISPIGDQELPKCKSKLVWLSIKEKEICE